MASWKYFACVQFIHRLVEGAIKENSKLTFNYDETLI